MLGHRAAVKSSNPWRKSSSNNRLGEMTAGDRDLTQIIKVASEWMIDFIFYCYCHYFKEGNYPEFERFRDAMEGMIQVPPTLESSQLKSVRICQFLSRIVEGKNLDSQFEQDKNITPLESALQTWTLMEQEQKIKNDTLFEEIKLLLQVQAVGVCMEKGQFTLAAEVLERLLEDEEPQQSLKSKLSLVINKKDPYHQFLQNFSYNRMLEKIKSFIGLALCEKSSNFLLKAATKVMEAKQLQSERLEMTENDKNYTAESEEERQTVDSSTTINEDNNVSEKRVRTRSCATDVEGTSEKSGDTEERILRAKKKLFSFHVKPWKPEGRRSSKKLAAIRQSKMIKDSKHVEQHIKSRKDATSRNQKGPRKRRYWLWEEDKQLKDGVRKFGVGNWTKILEYYDFNGRTSVMLKDRWRTMRKLTLVDSNSTDTDS